MTAKKQDNKSFEENFKELERISEWFEREDVDLEAGLEKFERGLALAKACEERLKIMENKVKEIKTKFSDAEEE